MMTIVFALIAAFGNALFALAQRQSRDAANGILFVCLSALVAAVLALVWAPLAGPVDAVAILRSHGRALLLGGAGLFLTYVGFNLLYSRFGTVPYVVYAALAVITTAVGVGVLYLREPVNRFHIAAMAFAVAAVALFAVGQSRS
ncbi:MAG: hypothetical protein JSR54_01555 [Proteobacteria bacterium]|nr:hypothetical protein [Pseudomonadota bacterium]